MSVPQIQNYEVRDSRTEKKVPLVNGVLLHSIYNPEKEAQNLANTSEDLLKEKNEILILGLGFGYHVNAIAAKMNELYGSDYRIIVIEPSIDIFNDCISLSLLDRKNILVYAGKTATEIFSDKDLIHFLLRKPTVIPHPASYNLYTDYFRSILTYEAPNTVGDSQMFVKSHKVNEYLKQFENNSNFDDVLFNLLPSKNTLTEMDFLALALSAITKKSCEKNKIQEDV